MCVRAEVCLVSAQKGIDAGLVDGRIKIFLIILIVASSIVVPLILKAAYKKDYLNNFHGDDSNSDSKDNSINKNGDEPLVNTNVHLEEGKVLGDI